MASQDRADIYARITAEIVAAIEAGTDNYSMPWHHDRAATARPVNVASGKTYRGVNVLALWVAAHSAGYPTGLWGTYRQWQELGAQVRKGERSTTVVFWNRSDPASRKTSRTAAKKTAVVSWPGVIRCSIRLRSTATLPSRRRTCRRPSASPTPRRSTRTSGSLRFTGGAQACYFPSADRVHMPDSAPSGMRRHTTASCFMRAFMRRPRSTG